MVLQKIRGTVDLYGQEVALFNYIVKIAQKYASLYGFQEISTPIIENSEVFHRILGETSDIINKETYTFLDREKTYITLRPEFTAPIARAVISNGMLQSKPLRLFSYGALFRHERPQKCRLRQFHQINYEYIGSPHLNVDIELIMIAKDILKALNISQSISLTINTLGSSSCRNYYKTALIEYLLKYKNELSEINQQRLEKNPLRILDTKDIKEQEILNDAPILYDFIDKASKSRFENILCTLKDLDINFKHSYKLVRGMDYYSDFIFEFVTDHLGSQGTVLAGGRYDNLISQMGGVASPAAGFAGGIERMIELLHIQKKEISNIEQIYIIPIGELAETLSIKIAHELREKKINVLLDYGITLKKRMKRANKLKVKYSIIFGAEELKKSSYILKDMANSQEIILQKTELIVFLKNKVFNNS